MGKVILRKTSRERRKKSIRKKVSGTSDMPRLSVFRSNKYIYPQLIDDATGKTLVSISLNEIREIHNDKSKSEAAFELGKLIAEKAKKAKIKSAVFDRGGYKYHGRVSKIAEGARKGGLNL